MATPDALLISVTIPGVFRTNRAGLGGLVGELSESVRVYLGGRAVPCFRSGTRGMRSLPDPGPIVPRARSHARWLPRSGRTRRARGGSSCQDSRVSPGRLATRLPRHGSDACPRSDRGLRRTSHARPSVGSGPTGPKSCRLSRFWPAASRAGACGTAGARRCTVCTGGGSTSCPGSGSPSVHPARTATSPEGSNTGWWEGRALSPPVLGPAWLDPVARVRRVGAA